MKKVLKIISIVLLSFVGVLVLISVLINIPAVQNFLIARITGKLSEDLHTRVTVRHVNFRLFNKFSLDGAYIEDHRQDTLLYAGEMRLNITDFFFLKERTVLKYVGLKDAVIHLNRPEGDSVWNYQFLLDAFSRPPSGNKPPPPSLDLRQADLQNIRIRKTDAWMGRDMLMAVDDLHLDARSLDLRKHQLLINNVTLTKPSFVIVDYPGSRPPSTTPASPAPALPDTTAGTLRWNREGWDMQVDRLTITGGAFGLIKKDRPHVERYFDPAHIAAFDINASMKNIRLVKDSIITQLSLSARERSGFEIKKLNTLLKISPAEMEFSQLDLTTNRSHIEDYYSMQFDDFSDMNDYVKMVFMRAHFKDAHISSDDIAYFAPELADWDKDIVINGTGYGTVDNLTGNEMQIRAGNNTQLKGHIKLRGLPDISETFIDFQADEFITNGRDMQQFMPVLRNIRGADLDQLSYIRFNGSFTGFIHDFVAYGNFRTNLGAFRSDLNMKLGKTRKAPVYSGSLSADGFNIGQLFHIPHAEAITFHAKLNGQGFNFNTLQASVDATIDEFNLYGYTYRHISTNGAFDKKLFTGQLLVEDPNLSLDFSGAINFNDSVPSFNFRSQIFRSDLRALNLTRDSITFRGKLDLNFAGNSIDNFLGDARLYDISLYKNKTRAEIDSVVVHSSVTGGEKSISLTGNEIEGYIKGDFNVQRLPAAARLLLNRYYPSLIAKPDGPLPPENFSFALSLGSVEKIIKAFTNKLGGLNYTEIKGDLNTTGGTLHLNARIPSFRYGRYRFSNINVGGQGKGDMLGVTTTFQGLYVGDSLLLPSAMLKATSHADTSYINFKTAATNTLNNADLYARIVTQQNGYKIKLLTSELVINNKDWHITPENEITLAKDFISVFNFNISHGSQKITLTSDKTDTSGTPSFLVMLQNLNLSDFAQFLSSDIRLEGRINGRIRVDDPLKKLSIAGQVQATDFRVNNDSIGMLNATALYSEAEGALHWGIGKKDNPARNFSLAGLIGLTEKNRQLRGRFDFNHANISLLETFMGDLVSRFKGFATGRLTLSGTTDAPSVNGAVRLDSVGLKVNYLGTYYTLTNETVRFTDNAVDAGTITLHDTYGHTAILSGKLEHDHFKDLYFNFNVVGEKFQFLHTTSMDNALYFGDVFANGKLTFYGPLNNMQMVVTVSSAKGTHLFLPLEDSKDIGKHDFIIFKQYGKELKDVSRTTSNKTNLTVRLNANMNPNAQIDVILDPTTGDMISATGNGALQMNVTLDGDLSLYGNYVIENGYYNFSFHNLLNRRFIITRGSTISWTGDPSDANVNITAVYSVPGGASLYDLVAGEIESGAALVQNGQHIRQREKVDVYLNLKGSLQRPDITYDIRLPEAGISTGSFAMTKLEQIKQDPNELLTQVTGLLVLGQFIPPASSTANSNLLRTGSLSNAGQWVSSQLTGVINNIFGNKLKNMGVDLNLNYNIYSATGEQGNPLQRNDLQLNVATSLFNNRVEVEVGPSIDWGRTNNLPNQAAINNSYFAGDFRVEYLITPDGHVRFFAFSRSNYDVLRNQNLTRSGLGIAYRRDFNTLTDLFENRKQQRYLDSVRMARFQELKAKETEETITDTLRNSRPAN